MSRIDQLQARLDWFRENYTAAKRYELLRFAEELFEELRVAAGLPESEDA